MYYKVVLILNVCDFNAMEIFSWSQDGEGRGAEAWASFTVYCFSTLRCLEPIKVKKSP
jgi:hypothetical protein